MKPQLDIIDRLRIDPGQRTLGELLQDREAALQEILRIRVEADRHLQGHRKHSGTDGLSSTLSQLKSGSLLRLKEVCELIGASRSSVYLWVTAGTFPKPTRIGRRAVRWRTDDVEVWLHQTASR